MVETSKYGREIRAREEADSLLFFVDLEPLTEAFGFTVVRRKKKFGIYRCQEMIVKPIFDEVVICSEHLAMLKINGEYACFDLSSKHLSTDFEYVSYKCVNEYAKLYTNPTRCSLYEAKHRRILSGERLYEDFNLKDFSTEYIWARRGLFYDYIHRGSGEIVVLPNIVMAYDTPVGMFGKNGLGKVTFYNETGTADWVKLRTAVLCKEGHLTLSNYTLNIQNIIDIYGNILNI